MKEHPLTSPASFYGEHVGDVHMNHGLAPNGLTIEEFRPIALEWAAKLLKIQISDIHSLTRKRIVGVLEVTVFSPDFEARRVQTLFATATVPDCLDLNILPSSTIRIFQSLKTRNLTRGDLGHGA